LEGKSINLLTLTDASSGQLGEQESRVSKSLFPFFELEVRPRKFSKPYVMLTCRVHPGETSASYALEGIINFLLSRDERSNLLLKYFVFLVVPLVNPDGVYHGTYRMDTLGHNLNRFYSTAQSHKQPAIFAIQAIAAHYSSRLAFFMDIHSHPHPNKGSFIYGNCHPQLEEQTESQLYAKLLSLAS
jgi:murein tripeptide amidase MpaA